MKGMRLSVLSLAFLFLIIGCAGVPVREALWEDHKVPAGNIEGNHFVGLRYPFKVSAPSHWKMSTEFPKFLKDLGYDEPSPNDSEQTELYIFNPVTQSCVQIDLTPAGRYSTFSQESIERLTTLAAGSLKKELEEEYGKDIEVELGPTTPASLKGVQFAAKKYATYFVKGERREQGWIYGFSEPYQVFILYLLFEKEGTSDRKDLETILSSFEYIPKK